MENPGVLRLGAGRLGDSSGEILWDGDVMGLTEYVCWPFIYPTLCFRGGTTINDFEHQASVALRAYNVAVSSVGDRISLKMLFPLN